MRVLRKPLILLLALLLTLVAGRRADAQAVPSSCPCQEGVLPSRAQSCICVPDSGWNGQLVVFAHGYIAPNEDIAFYHLDLPDGTSGVAPVSWTVNC